MAGPRPPLEVTSAASPRAPSKKEPVGGPEAWLAAASSERCWASAPRRRQHGWGQEGWSALRPGGARLASLPFRGERLPPAQDTAAAPAGLCWRPSPCRNRRWASVRDEASSGARPSGQEGKRLGRVRRRQVLGGDWSPRTADGGGGEWPSCWTPHVRGPPRRLDSPCGQPHTQPAAHPGGQTVHVHRETWGQAVTAAPLVTAKR